MYGPVHVDVTDIPGAAFMDRVVLIGKDGKDEITVEEFVKIKRKI